MKKLFVGLALITSLILSQNATALLVSVEPDEYSTGTDISALFPGVTLSVIGSDVESGYIDPEVYSVSPGSATTGTQLFGNRFGTDLYTQGWFLDARALRVDFLNPVNVISIDMVGRNHTIGVMNAYNVNGILVDTFSTELLTLDEHEKARINRNNYDISYVILGSSYLGSALRLDNLTFNTRVPEPTSLGLLALGISVLSFARRLN